MKQQNVIVLTINDTEYQFEINPNKKQSSICNVSISFLSLERNWVLIFEDEEMMFNQGLWYFKRRELPEAIMQKELLISQFIVKQRITV